MKKIEKIDEWALHAHVDGELAGEMNAEIEAYLKTDAEAAKRIEAWRQQRIALKQMFDSVLDEPIPASLHATLRNGGSWRARPYMNIAAALTMLVIGGAAGWFLGHDPAGYRLMSIADQAIVAHEVYAAEVKHPVEVLASEKDHLQAWLSKRVGSDFVVPDLADEGYTLLGGRLLAAENRPAAQLMYEDSEKKRITIFLTSNPGNSKAAVQIQQQGNLVACYWLDGRLAYAVAGEMDRDSMMRLAKVIYDQFDS